MARVAIHVRTTKAQMRRLISAFVVRYSSFFVVFFIFFDEEASHKLKWRTENDTGNLLFFHRICHFRAIQPFDF